MAFLEVNELTRYNGEDQVVGVVSFVQHSLQKLAIAGETGSGKSTLLKMMAGLVQPDSGQVLFEGRKVMGPDDQLVAGHPHIAYLSQHFELPKSLRVEQVLDYANALSQEEADLLYEVCDITHLLARRTDQLSGGEKQRVALARLLSASPRLLLLDEPFSNLDRVHKQILQQVIYSIGEQLAITIILVSHDPADTLSWADEMIVMKEGRIVQQGTPQQVYHSPVSEYVAGLFGKYSVITAAQANALHVREGMILRPEALSIDGAGWRSQVVRISFYGGHYELEVSDGQEHLLLRTNENHWKINQHVYVSVSPSYIARLK